MNAQQTASEKLTEAIKEVEAAATGTTFSVPEMRVASMRLALAASNYRLEVSRGEVEAARMTGKFTTWARVARWLAQWWKR
jgi:hypothetical protein